MDKEILQRYKKNKKELKLINHALDKLDLRLANVQTVSGRVMKSDQNFPYIQGYTTVEMPEPQEASEIKKRILAKQQRKKVIQKEQKEVEEFIASMPDGKNKQVFEMIYLDNEDQRYVADMLGVSQGRISQIIKNVVN